MTATNSTVQNPLVVPAPTVQQDPDGLQKVVTGGSDFLSLREQGYLMVDKTALIPMLVTMRNVFLSRPRRFGKSTLLAMIKELYTNGTEKFKGLAVHEQGLWHEPIIHHVILIDFNELSNPNTFEKDLLCRLCSAFEQAGFHSALELQYKDNHLNTIYGELIKLQQNEHIVVLIDEWDFPLSSNLHDREAFEKNKEILKGFYSWLRGLDNVDFTMVTGIMRFKDTAVLTGQYIYDISMEPTFAPLLGYTKEELKTNFAAYITKTAALNNSSEDELLKKIELKYDGFCFDADAALSLYCPLSINAFFRQVYINRKAPPRFDSFWMDTANTPQGLRKYLKLHQIDFDKLEQIKATGITLTQNQFTSQMTFDNVELVPLLVQGGFMSVKGVVDPEEDDRYDRQLLCKFTNAEVEKLYAKVLLGYITDSSSGDGLLDNEMWAYIRKVATAVRGRDIITAVNGINAVLAHINYELWANEQDREVFYRVLIALILEIGLGPNNVRQEVPNNNGRSDIEVLVGDSLVVFELKLARNKKRKSAKKAADAAKTSLLTEPASLATQIRLSKEAYDQVVNKGYGSGTMSYRLKHWYGVVLVVSAASRQICYWRHFDRDQELGHGAVKPIVLNNPNKL